MYSLLVEVLIAGEWSAFAYSYAALAANILIFMTEHPSCRFVAMNKSLVTEKDRPYGAQLQRVIAKHGQHIIDPPKQVCQSFVDIDSEYPGTGPLSADIFAICEPTCSLFDFDKFQ